MSPRRLASPKSKVTSHAPPHADCDDGLLLIDPVGEKRFERLKVRREGIDDGKVGWTAKKRSHMDC
jgi:hypothetical protein